LAISCVSNYAAGISEEEINHEEVMEIGKLVAETFKNLLKRVIPKIAQEK
jgi:purine-nucleoside phosphorylase